MLNRLKKIELFAVIGTKMNPQKWVKKYESQVGESDMLKLKIVIFHDDHVEVIHMTQLIRFGVADLFSIDG